MLLCVEWSFIQTQSGVCPNLDLIYSEIKKYKITQYKNTQTQMIQNTLRRCAVRFSVPPNLEKSSRCEVLFTFVITSYWVSNICVLVKYKIHEDTWCKNTEIQKRSYIVQCGAVKSPSYWVITGCHPSSTLAEPSPSQAHRGGYDSLNLKQSMWTTNLFQFKI